VLLELKLADVDKNKYTKNVSRLVDCDTEVYTAVKSVFFKHTSELNTGEYIENGSS